MSEIINNLSTGIRKNEDFITQKNNKTAKLIDLGGGRNSNYSSGRDINYASLNVGRPVNEDCDVTAGLGEMPLRQSFITSCGDTISSVLALTDTLLSLYGLQPVEYAVCEFINRKTKCVWDQNLPAMRVESGSILQEFSCRRNIR